MCLVFFFFFFYFFLFFKISHFQLEEWKKPLCSVTAVDDIFHCLVNKFIVGLRASFFFFFNRQLSKSKWSEKKHHQNKENKKTNTIMCQSSPSILSLSWSTCIHLRLYLHYFELTEHSVIWWYDKNSVLNCWEYRMT